MIAGVRIGHATDRDGGTGCTVIVPPDGSVASAEVRGLAPGTRELDLLAPHATVDHIDAILLTGGSAFGLAAADGVVAALVQEGRGFPTPAGPVPIVAAAVIFDRMLGEPVAPDAAMGRCAYEAARTGVPARGTVGAGTGATVGSLDGTTGACKGGVGWASVAVPGGARVAALAVVNAFGDVVGADGEILAGLRRDGVLVGTEEVLLAHGLVREPRGEATTLVCVLTDATIDKVGCHLLARAAHGGIARATRPAATTFDGDTAFAVATRALPAPPRPLLEVAAARATTAAIADAVRAATGLHGVEPG
jgi:L-aminopeptidase/D-esterase-like protein